MNIEDLDHYTLEEICDNQRKLEGELFVLSKDLENSPLKTISERYEGMESAYLSASDKVLRLGVENDRIKASNKALFKACREAQHHLLNNIHGSQALAMSILSQAIANATK